MCSVVEIKTYDNGRLIEKEIYENNQLHSRDQPAYVSYREDGSIKLEIYYHRDRVHRKGGPAYIYHKVENYKPHEFKSMFDYITNDPIQELHKLHGYEAWFRLDEPYTPTEKELSRYKTKYNITENKVEPCLATSYP